MKFEYLGKQELGYHLSQIPPDYFHHLVFIGHSVYLYLERHTRLYIIIMYLIIYLIYIKVFLVCRECLRKRANKWYSNRQD